MSNRFYDRYWTDQHIKSNGFDNKPTWSMDDFYDHISFFFGHRKSPRLVGRCLDYGCGDGTFLSKLYEFDKHGVDVSAVAVDQARKTYPWIAYQVIDRVIPYPHETFDVVFAIDVLEHIVDLESALEEMHRVLKPDGRLLIATSEFTRMKMIGICLTAFHRFFYPTTPHVRYFTRRNLADLLKRKGFEVLAYKARGKYFGLIPKGQMVIARKLTGRK